MTTSRSEARAKRCNRCQEVLPRRSFHKHRRHRDGLTTWCAECNIENQRQVRLLKDRVLGPSWRAELNQKRYVPSQQCTPEKRAARAAANARWRARNDALKGEQWRAKQREYDRMRAQNPERAAQVKRNKDERRRRAQEAQNAVDREGHGSDRAGCAAGIE